MTLHAADSPKVSAGDPSPAAAALRDSAQDIVTLGWHHRLFSHIPRGEFVRYLGVGVFNTLFGYTTFAVINYFLHRRNVPVSYLFASASSNFINITVAFLGYKFLVFRTRGNYFNEWLKAMAVYWSGFLPSLLLLPALVRLLNWLLPAHLPVFHHDLVRRDIAPDIANAVLLAFGVVYSFLGHKNVTFRRPDPGPAGPDSAAPSDR
jgi:putative flippase GtrA